MKPALLKYVHLVTIVYKCERRPTRSHLRTHTPRATEPAHNGPTISHLGAQNINRRKSFPIESFADTRETNNHVTGVSGRRQGAHGLSAQNTCAGRAHGILRRGLGARCLPSRMKPTVHPVPPCVVSAAPKSAIPTTATCVRIDGHSRRTSC